MKKILNFCKYLRLTANNLIIRLLPAKRMQPAKYYLSLCSIFINNKKNKIEQFRIFFIS